MNRYSLYAWHPTRFDPRGKQLNKFDLIKHLDTLSEQPPAANQSLVDLAVAIETWAQQQQLINIFDRVTVRSYVDLAESYRHEPTSYFKLSNLPSINFDSFYYTFITQAMRLGLIVHSDIDNGTYYPDNTSEPAFLISRLNNLKLKQSAQVLLNDMLQSDAPAIKGQTLATRAQAATVNVSGRSAQLRQSSSNTAAVHTLTSAHKETTIVTGGAPLPTDPLLNHAALQSTSLTLSNDDTEILSQLKLAIETYLKVRRCHYKIHKRLGSLGWEVHMLWKDSDVLMTFMIERSYAGDKTKLNMIFKISPPQHYKDASFRRLFTGDNALNILYKNQLCIEASLRDLEQYNALQHSPLPHPQRAELTMLAGLQRQTDADIDFVFGLLEAHDSFYHLFDAIYQDDKHPLHDFYWGAAESKPLSWSRFSRRHNVGLTLARLLQHPELPDMIEAQRPLLLAYYDTHSEAMPIMRDLKAQFVRMCDTLMQGYQPQ